MDPNLTFALSKAALGACVSVLFPAGKGKMAVVGQKYILLDNSNL
jgi:hypothetical protein